MWTKFKNFITQDVKNENEVKMYAVIVRIFLIIFALYLLVGSIYTSFREQYISVLLCMVALIVSVGLFTATYYNRTRMAAVGTWFMFALLMVLQTYLYGTHTGVYQFMYIMIMMIFTLDYIEKLRYKIIGLAFTLILWTVIYGLLDTRTPVYVLNDNSDTVWLSVNMLVVGAMVAVTAILSTADFSDMRKKLMETNAHFREMAGRDPLTGMYNRRATLEYLDKRLEDFENGSLSAITVVMADIDHFKNVNDTYGHDNGDVVLVSIADSLGSFMRGRGIPSRWGGEEFVLIFTGVNGDVVYQELYELRREINSKTFNFGGQEINITLTYGVAEFGSDDKVEDVIKSADEKLYMGKEKGRNVVIF